MDAKVDHEDIPRHLNAGELRRMLENVDEGTPIAFHPGNGRAVQGCVKAQVHEGQWPLVILA